MGPGYPEVIQGPSQMEGSSENLVDSSAHNKDNVKIDLVVCQPGKQTIIMSPRWWFQTPV